jgi:hypothetical protein
MFGRGEVSRHVTTRSGRDTSAESSMADPAILQDLIESDIAVLSYCTVAFVVYSASFGEHEAVESSWP